MPADLAQADALFFDGNRHLEGGRTAKAEDCFRQALALVPDHAEALANLGCCGSRPAPRARPRTAIAGPSPSNPSAPGCT